MKKLLITSASQVGAVGRFFLPQVQGIESPSFIQFPATGVNTAPLPGSTLLPRELLLLGKIEISNVLPIKIKKR